MWKRDDFADMIPMEETMIVLLILSAWCEGPCIYPKLVYQNSEQEATKKRQKTE